MSSATDSSFMNRASLSIAVCALIAACAAPLCAQQAHVYEFLRSDAAARAAAMGGAFLTVADDPTALHYNAASLATLERSQASFSFYKHLLDINSGYAVVSTDVRGVGAVGVAAMFTDYGSFEQTDPYGNVVGDGSFGALDLALTAGWATDLGEGFRAGVAAKAVFSSIADSSSIALALDGGLLWIDTTNRIQAGVTIRNLGSQLSSYAGVTESMPLDLSVGVSHNLRGLPLLIALNVHRLLDDSDGFFDHFSAFALGGEFTIADPVRLRVGYNNRLREDMVVGGSKGLAGLSAGVGILVSDYRFDYAFTSLARIGAQHRISINAMF